MIKDLNKYRSSKLSIPSDEKFVENLADFSVLGCILTYFKLSNCTC